MTGFEIRPDSLRGSAEGIDQSVDRLAEAIEQFEARLRAFGDPWGGDDIGSLIGELYGLIHDVALTCFESNGEFSVSTPMACTSWPTVSTDRDGHRRWAPANPPGPRRVADGTAAAR